MKTIKVNNSSVVSGYFYSEETEMLLVEFHNESIYLYKDVSPATVKKVFSAESVGKTLKKMVIDKHQKPLRIK